MESRHSQAKGYAAVTFKATSIMHAPYPTKRRADLGKKLSVVSLLCKQYLYYACTLANFMLFKIVLPCPLYGRTFDRFQTHLVTLLT